jgi:hypothetical protein
MATVVTAQAVAQGVPGDSRHGRILVRLASVPICGLVLLSFAPRIGETAALQWYVRGSAAALALMLLVLFHRIRRDKRVLSFSFSPRRVHYVQLLMHGSI